MPLVQRTPLTQHVASIRQRANEMKSNGMQRKNGHVSKKGDQIIANSLSASKQLTVYSVPSFVGPRGYKLQRFITKMPGPRIPHCCPRGLSVPAPQMLLIGVSLNKNRPFFLFIIYIIVASRATLSCTYT